MAQKVVDPTPGPGGSSSGGSGGINLGNAPAPVDKKKSSNIGQAFNNYIKTHKTLAPYSDAIWQMAQEYNVDPVYLAVLLIHESGGIHLNPDGSLKMNKEGSGAAGIAQIMVSTWLNQKGPDGKIITREMIDNPRWQIRFAAWLLNQGLNTGVGYDTVYSKGGQWAYNSKAGKNDNPFLELPKGYVFKGWRNKDRPVPGVGTPGQDLDANQAAAGDPWVTGVAKGGKLSLSSSGSPPSNVLKFDGAPMAFSDFQRLKRQLEETYVSYTGKRPSNAQIQQFVLKGWSGYSLSVLLSQGSSFVNSPLWKSKAPVYKAAAQNLMAPGQKVDNEMIRQAIVNNWSPDVLQAQLRKADGYVKSNEFKGQSATMSNVFQSIYGTPTEGANALIHEATLGGWTPDQFAAWLRSRDEYVYTPEYRAKATSLVEALGFMTGKVATLQAPTGPAPKSDQPSGFGPLPNDKRIKGEPSITPGPALMPTVQP